MPPATAQRHECKSQGVYLCNFILTLGLRAPEECKEFGLGFNALKGPFSPRTSESSEASAIAPDQHCNQPAYSRLQAVAVRFRGVSLVIGV